MSVAIGTTVYNDNVAVPNTTDEMETDNDVCPPGEIMTEFKGSLVIVPDADPSHMRFSKVGIGASFPLGYDVLVGGEGDPIVSFRNDGKVLWIEKRDSTWMLPDHILNGGVAIKIADKGGVHKDASAVHGQNLMSMSQSGYIYEYPPTSYSYDEIRYKFRSYNIKRMLDSMAKSNLNLVRCVNYESQTKNQIWFAIPYGPAVTTNGRVLVFDPILAQMNKRKESWWIFEFNHDIKSMEIVLISGVTYVMMGDSNGVVYLYPSTDGDGAEENGTVTSAGAATLTDSTQAWTISEFVNLYVWTTDGTGAGQKRRITANTATQLTVTPDWTTVPDSTTEYSIGGYEKSFFSNWKNYGKEALRKRFRAIRAVARQEGNYDIQVIFKKDFDESEGQATILPFNLAAGNSLWGVMKWGIDPWGAQAVVRGRLKFHAKFNSIQIGFRNFAAGMPFALEGFTTFHQGITYRTRL